MGMHFMRHSCCVRFKEFGAFLAHFLTNICTGTICAFLSWETLRGEGEVKAPDRRPGPPNSHQSAMGVNAGHAEDFLPALGLSRSIPKVGI